MTTWIPSFDEENATADCYKGFTFKPVHSDFLYILESARLIFFENIPTAPFAIRKKGCLGWLMSDQNIDLPMSTFFCSAWLSYFNGQTVSTLKHCNKKWKWHELQKMPLAQLQSLFEIVPNIPPDTTPPDKLDVKSNGVTRYTYTRPMTDQEEYEYHRKAFEEMRKRGYRTGQD